MKNLMCPHCQNDRLDLIEYMPSWKVWVCTVCSKMFEVIDERLPQGTTDRTSKGLDSDATERIHHPTRTPKE